jgi:hypothetical protein
MSASLSAVIDEYAERQEAVETEMDDIQPMDSEEEEEVEEHGQDITSHPLFDQYYNFGGDRAIMTMTNFTSFEFRTLFGMAEEAINSYYSRGRGKKPSTKPLDAFFILVSTVKFYAKWEKAALDWNMKTSTFETLIKRTLRLSVTPLRERLMPRKTMKQLRQEQIAFPNHTDVLLAIDVRFQSCNRPKGLFEESRHYFSGKHWSYGIKTESAHYPNGQVAFISSHHPGSVSDFTIFTQNASSYREMTRKPVTERNLSDHGNPELKRRYPDSWGIIADRGYQGADGVLRAYTPKKGQLTAEEEEENRRISQDRVIVENFYGRATSLWGALRDKWRWDHEIFDLVQEFAYLLTNYHISLNPLRASDGDFYRKVLMKYKMEGKKRAEKEKRWRQASRERRRRRLEMARMERATRLSQNY